MTSGKLIAMETIGVPILNGKLDSRHTRWTESMNDDIPYAYALRVFHVRESSSSKTSSSSKQSHIGELLRATDLIYFWWRGGEGCMGVAK